MIHFGLPYLLRRTGIKQFIEKGSNIYSRVLKIAILLEKINNILFSYRRVVEEVDI
jgi:hypothetical protein